MFINSQSLVGDGASLDLAMVEARRLFQCSSRRRSFAPAATWNLHTTQPKYFAPTYSEVVNLTGLM
jgi:hypothetical protein